MISGTAASARDTGQATFAFSANSVKPASSRPGTAPTTVRSIWAIVVINLANVGITLSISEQFWLTATPNLIGSALRIPYTFALPRFGGRMWTFISAALLLIPTTLLAVVVPSGWLADQSHDTQMLVLLFCAATAGVGGGNFSSSMANISFFYPDGKKGLALGINAAEAQGEDVGHHAHHLTPLLLIAPPSELLALPAGLGNY